MSQGAKSMAELMAKQHVTLQTLRRGQTVTGKITKMSSAEIYLDVNSKTEALVLEKDRRLLKQLLHFLQVGDTVEATVISPESEMGYPVVSLRRFVEQKLWEELESLQKSGEKVDVMVTDSTKGGFLVESNTGISGFMPNSHVSGTVKPEELVGTSIKASIVELNKEARKVVFSQKGVVSSDDFKKIAAQYKSGQKVHGIISGVTAFGLFVSLPYSKSSASGKASPHPVPSLSSRQSPSGPTPLPKGEGDQGEDVSMVDGLIHISEIRWEKVEDLQGMFAVGEKVEAVVLGVDADGKRIDLSLKRLTADPFAEVSTTFSVDKKVKGTVKEITDQGLNLDLGMVGAVQVEGMIKKDKISPDAKYEVGQEVTATVVSVDAKRRKIMLTPVLKEKPLMYR